MEKIFMKKFLLFLFLFCLILPSAFANNFNDKAKAITCACEQTSFSKGRMTSNSSVSTKTFTYYISGSSFYDSSYNKIRTSKIDDNEINFSREYRSGEYYIKGQYSINRTTGNMEYTETTTSDGINPIVIFAQGSGNCKVDRNLVKKKF